MFDNIKKITAVVFLTVLIWAWAYLATEQETTESGTLNISTTTSPNLLVDFGNVEKTPVAIRLTLKGSAAKIADLKKGLRLSETEKDKIRLEFFYDVEKEGQTQAGTYPFKLLDFLKNSDAIKMRGLAVNDCKIGSEQNPTIEVKVEELTEKLLPVVCIDEKGSQLSAEIIEPASIKMYVRDDYEDGAIVALTAQQIIQARKKRIDVTPYVELISGQRKWAKNHVKLKLPPTEEKLKSGPFQTTKIGFLISENMIGKFKPEIQNTTQLTSSIMISATEEALEAYKNMQFHIVIEIEDGDENEAELTKPVIYNFPAEYVRKNEIELDEESRTARLKLIPVADQPTTP